jgi:putative transposase
MKIVRISFGVRGFATVYNDAVKWSRMLQEKSKHKIKVLVFMEKHGLDATLDAFPHKRSTIFSWKKALKDGNGRLESLNEKSTRPKSARKADWDENVVKFIENQRNLHHRLGKDKLKPLLDKYCLVNNLKTESASTIGRILDYLKEKRRIPTGKRLSFNGKTGNLSEHKKYKRPKIRRKDYKPEQPGDLLQVDTIVKFINGIKRYIVTAIDLKSEFAFAYGYRNHSSQSTADFFAKLQSVAPFQIKRIQTDNGSEFDHLFRDYALKQNIIHFHNYPKCPKMNAYVERFNRTIQEEFIDYYVETLSNDLEDFNEKLIQWLLWYNTERPHHTLGQTPPMQYVVNYLTLNAEKSRMLWTHTLICVFEQILV